jgi:hypothetical protein
MASAKDSLKLSASLKAAADLRAKRLGYRSRSDYIRNLMRYDMLVQGGHDVTLPLSKLEPAVQDRIDAELLSLTERGEGQRGQLLARLIERVVTAGADPNGANIARTIRGIVTKKLSHP